MIDGAYFNPGVIQQLLELIDTVKAMDEAAKKATDTMADLAEAWDELAAMAGDDTDYGTPLPERHPLRPPRYIGPKSKTAPRVQRVGRVARSSCRKIRR